MIIKSLQVENFNNIKKAEFDFTKRINLFSGNAGQGKSTILEAIEYPFTNFLKAKIDLYKRDGIHDFYIREIFDHLGSKYDIEIESTKSGVKKKLIINDDKKNPKINSDASKYLATIINPTLTKYSAIAEQEKTAVLLEQKPSERLKKFKEIFGIDNITFIVEQIKNDIRENKNRVSVLEAELNILKNKSFSFQEVPKMNDNEVELENEIQVLEKEKIEYDKVLNLYKTYETLLNSYNESQQKLNDIKNNLVESEEDLQNKQSRIKSVPEYDSNKLLEIQKQLSELEKEQIKYNNELHRYSDAQKKIRKFENEVIKLKESQEQYKFKKIGPCKYNDADLKERINQVNNLTIALKEIENSISLAKQGKCPTCKQNFIADLNELDSDWHETNHFLNISKDDVEIVSKEIENHKKSIEENNVNRIQYENHEDKIISIENEIQELKLIEKPEEKIFDTDIYLKQINEQQLIKEQYDLAIAHNNSINREIEELKSNIKFYNQQVVELQKVEKPKEIEKPEGKDYSELDIKKEELTILKQMKKEIERIEKYNEDIRLDKKRNDKEVSIKERKLDFFWSENRILEQCKDVMNRDFSSFVIDKGAVYIKEKMNEFFTRSYGRYLITFEQDKDKIEFFYKKDGGIPRPVIKASGFERQALGISTHTALCSMQNLGIFIADEIDSQASYEDSYRLFEILFSEEQFKQTFLTTHNDEIKEYIMQREDSQKFTIKNGEVISR